ncbi:unnamed protein product [Brassica napus]|uniref:(rape) hypothetical protein n=1 Tax=Brassica napus TaxID=3708 RepID=A0A817B484_BRANA|nr:unnamed protein product [Brassica napus]
MDVVVKVQHPGIERLMMTDIRNLQLFALYVQRTDIKFDLYSITKEMETQIGYEFDFKREANAMERIRHFLYENNKKSPVIVPRVLRDTVTNDGRSRQFAFIGFRKEEEAQEAITYLNKTYIDTLRISVEVANPPSSFDSLEKEGKFNENGDKTSDANYAQGTIKIKKKPEGDDPRLQELLEDKRKFWSNNMFIPRKEKVSPVISIGAMRNKAKTLLLLVMIALFFYKTLPWVVHQNKYTTTEAN